MVAGGILKPASKCAKFNVPSKWAGPPALPVARLSKLTHVAAICRKKMNAIAGDSG
jgi:hypothetical protein